MKRLVVALAAIGLTTSLGVYAALPTGAQATEVNVPQNEDGLFVGASALYWQPTLSGNDLDYAVTQTNQQIHNVKPGYNWGFDVFGGYNFGNGIDVMLEYLQLDTNDSSSTGPGGGFIIPAHYFATNTSLFFQNSESGTLNQNNFDTYQRAYGKAKIDLGQGDLTVGQYLNIGCADQLRLFVGLRYAELQRELTSNYSQNPNDAGNTNLGSGVTTSSITNGDGTFAASHGALQAYDDSDYKGIGPLIGLSNTYYIGYGFGFIAGFDMGLLIGDLDDSLTLTNYQAGMTAIANAIPPVMKVQQELLGSVTANGAENITTTTVQADTDSGRRLVPVVDAKLGFDYTYPLQNYGSLTLEAGWSVSHYWNAVDGIDAGASDANLINSSSEPSSNSGNILVNGFTNVTPTHHTNSVGYQGPYVTLTYRAIPTA